MGVPSFYRWLVEKYPDIVSPAVEVPDDAAGRSGGEDGAAAVAVYDNLYLDMNGIIHPCFHPEYQTAACPPPATTFDEVFRSMFDYMDRLIRIVRPRRLLYLAVDGVAPRAKMNQQRARRFKSAKAAKDAEVEENLLRERFMAQGKEVLPREEACEVSDPNVITPGTEFMDKLSAALEYYVCDRLNTDPSWKDIKVILSDANVPGEGEHKIMSFIRAQRSTESYDPNTRHCLYGLDADLIMLALASHEVHFSILREDVLRDKHQLEIVPINEKHFTELAKVTQESHKCKLPKKPYQFLNIWVLREYLEIDLKALNGNQDIERLIDDFIFICFLMGNDFIPHIPSLEIHEFAVDLLIGVYKKIFNTMGGYIIDTNKVKDKNAAYLKVSRLEKFLHELSLCEEKIFLKRYELRENFMRKIQREAAENEWNERNSENMEESSDCTDLMTKSFSTECSISRCNSDDSDVTENSLELKRNLKDLLRNKQDLLKNGHCKLDRIKLGLPGWKDRFYTEKFGVESNEVGKLKIQMAQKYLEGLCWVLRYYFSDVPSWSWYCPFYYAPFASDLKRLSQFKISFSVDEPLTPFDQLMAVLPPESSCALPKCYSKLIDCEESAIHMFYPSELEIDIQGKRFLWQGVAKLPFIDAKLLVSVTKTVEKDLAIHETRRNTIRQEKIFLRNSNALANNAAFVPMSDCSNEKLPVSSSEIAGWLSPDDDAPSNGLFRSPMKDLPDITPDQTISAMFFNPEVVKPISRLLDNVTVPDKTVTEDDISERPLWHTYRGPRPTAAYNMQRYSRKPETPWRESSPVTPTDGIKNSGTGWLGRGRGSAAASAETRHIWRSSYGWGRGNAFAAETQQQRRGISNYGRGLRGADTAPRRGSQLDDGGAYSLRPGGGWTGRGGPHGQVRGSTAAAAEPQPTGRSCYGQGGWNAETQHQRSRSSWSNDAAGAYSIPLGGTWAPSGAPEKQQTAWRQVRPWARGGGGTEVAVAGHGRTRVLFVVGNRSDLPLISL